MPGSKEAEYQPHLRGQHALLSRGKLPSSTTLRLSAAEIPFLPEVAGHIDGVDAMGRMKRV